MSLTEKIYEVAWELLIERYKDKRVIKSHLKALFDIPVSYKEY